jgi:hypothetical protein
VRTFSLLTLIWYAAIAFGVYALVDAAIQPTAAYVAAGKLTKPAWVAILAVALVVIGMGQWFGVVGLAAIVATIVYFVDVRPAVRRFRG